MTLSYAHASARRAQPSRSRTGGLGRVMGLALAACIGWAGWSTQATGADASVPEPIARLLGSVVGIYAEVPPTARSAQNLGTTRGGSGIVIGDDGLVLTVGYLTTDAHTINVLAPGVGPVPGDLVGYDHETGFGLVRARQPLKTPAVRFGDSDLLRKGSPVLVASIGAQPLTAAYVMDRRAYAGSWEYLLENAIYTAPVHPNFGGAALVGPEGQLLGVGSLMVNVSDGFHPPLPGNIFIPINLLKPILGDLVRDGRAGGRTNPWLGIYTAEQAGRVVVQRLAPEGPGERAGLQAGDLIVGVSGKRVGDMTAFLRQVWTAGRAGDPIALDILRPARGTLDIDRVTVNSISRYDWQRRAQPR